MKDSELIQQALDTWGRDKQLDMTVEECSELILAICKSRRESVKPGYDRTGNLIEEIADVAIMIEQCQAMFPKVDWQLRRSERLGRLEQLLAATPRVTYDPDLEDFYDNDCK